jgi:hypothetical protein
MKIWLWPVVIGVLSGVGLVSALLYDGPGDWISWLTLFCPVAISAWCGWLRTPANITGGVREDE